MMDLRLVRAMTPMNEAEAERLVDIWCDVLEGTPIDLICHEFTIEISHGKEAFFPAPSRIRDGAHELTRRRRDDIAALDRLAQIAGGELPAPRVASINEWRNLPRADKPVSLMQRWREFQRNAAAGDGEGSA